MTTRGERILIVKTSSMGDVVHAAPLVSDIARARPEAKIDWVVEEGFAAIAALHSHVDRVIAVALRRWRGAILSGSTWRELRAARARLREHDYAAIIDCQGLIKSALLARCARGPRWGYDRASAREPLAAALYTHPVAVPRAIHAIARNRALGAAALGTDAGGAPRFDLAVPPLREPALHGAARSPYAVLLTNASRASKLWPDERWRAIERWLSSQGLASLLFWGTDAERQATELRASGMSGAPVAPRCALDQLAAVLAGARIVIGLDTGLTHLAAAVGSPTLGIFCDYDPRLVGITGSGPCASAGGVDSSPSADEVIKAAQRLLEARR